MGNSYSSDNDVDSDIGAVSGAITIGTIVDEEEVLEVVGAEQAPIYASATLENRPEARRMIRGTEDPNSLKTPKRPETPSHNDVDSLVDSKMRQTSGSM